MKKIKLSYKMSKDYEQAVSRRGNSKTATACKEMSLIIGNQRKVK